MARHHAVFLNDAPAQIANVYGGGRRERLAGMVELYPEIIGSKNAGEHRAALAEAEVAFSTWGMWAPSAEQFALMPKLKAVFYAAGSVQNFARPFLDRGLTVMSSWGANGVPVAEYTVAQIILANKGYFRNLAYAKLPPSQRRQAQRPTAPGNLEVAISLLGAGMIGKLVIGLLKPYQIRVLVFDPFLPDATAAELGVTKVSLAEAFSQGRVVSCHLANLPSTKGMLRGKHFRLMADDATFINTGRGATVNEPEMIAELARRPSLTALLDVTYPEPPAEDSPLYRLPNVFLSTHIAGSLGQEVWRMADYAMDEYQRWASGQPLRYGVTHAMLETMA